MENTIFVIETMGFIPNDTYIGADVEFHLSFTESTKEYQYGRTNDADIYCGGEIGLL